MLQRRGTRRFADVDAYELQPYVVAGPSFIEIQALAEPALRFTITADQPAAKTFACPRTRVRI